MVLVLVGNAAVLRFGARQWGGGGKWRAAVLTFGARQQEVDGGAGWPCRLVFGVGWPCHLVFGVGWPCHLAFGVKRRVGFALCPSSHLVQVVVVRDGERPCRLTFDARWWVGGEVSVGLNATELHSTLLHLI